MLASHVLAHLPQSGGKAGEAEVAELRKELSEAAQAMADSAKKTDAAARSKLQVGETAAGNIHYHCCKHGTCCGLSGLSM